MAEDLHCALFLSQTIQTYIYQYGCLDDLAVEAGPASIEPEAGPIPAGAQAPVTEVTDLKWKLWTGTVSLTEPRHLATPLRH
jgi:hypothetical protein